MCFITVLLFSSCKDAVHKSYDILISNVKIVDVGSGKITEGKLVLIEGDTISRIVEEKDINKFNALQTMDAGGAFLMPGLWDMHVHFRGGDSLIEENKELIEHYLVITISLFLI